MPPRDLIDSGARIHETRTVVGYHRTARDQPRRFRGEANPVVICGPRPQTGIQTRLCRQAGGRDRWGACR
jgi:hypothetical protein